MIKILFIKKRDKNSIKSYLKHWNNWQTIVLLMFIGVVQLEAYSAGDAVCVSGAGTSGANGTYYSRSPTTIGTDSGYSIDISRNFEIKDPQNVSLYTGTSLHPSATISALTSESWITSSNTGLAPVPSITSGWCNTAPTITGTESNQTVNDKSTLTPFANVILADSENNNISISITLDDNAKGVLSSTTIVSGSIESVQTTLRAIVFTPTANRVSIGSTETTTFSITANDGIVDSIPNTGTTVVTSVNVIPTVSSVNFKGTLQVGQTLTGSYTYNDTEGDAESGTTYQWYRSDTAEEVVLAKSSFNNNFQKSGTAIAGATSLTYVLTTEDIGKFMIFEVTPANANGTGDAIQSAINSTAVTSAPVATSTSTATATSTDNTINVTSTEGTERTNTSISFNPALSVSATSDTEATIRVNDISIEASVSPTGVATTSVDEGNGIKSSLENRIRGSQTSIDSDGNVKSVLSVDSDTQLETTLSSDGTITHSTTAKGATTEVHSSVKGATVVVDEQGNTELRAQVEKNGFIYKAVITVSIDGEAKTKFVKVNIATNEETDISSTLNEDSSFERGNRAEVVELNDLVYIKVTTPINGVVTIK